MNRKRNNQSNAAVSQPSLMLLVSSLLLAQLLRIGVKIEQVAAEGLGEIILRRDGALWGTEFGDTNQHQALGLPVRKHMQKSRGYSSSATALQEEMISSLDYQEYARLVKLVQIDVVAPNKDLVELMNLVSTKSRAHFLKEHEHFFKKLDLGETSRPMLMTYLGLELVPIGQMRAWFEGHSEARGQRTVPNVAKSCKSLLKQRCKSFDTMPRRGEQLLALAERLRSAAETHPETSQGKLQIAQVAFRNNLNLFMLENYLILCSRLDLEELKEEFATYKELF